MTLNDLKKLTVLAGMAGMMCSCKNANKINRLTDSIEAKEETLADVEERIAKEKASLESYTELKAIADKHQAVMEKLDGIEDELEAEKARSVEAAAALKEATLKFINYRNEYRRSERGGAKGTLIDLSATKGPDYKDVRISRITPLELRVLLKSGPKGVPFSELPVSVQERFQFSEEEAMAYRQAVAKYRQAQARANIAIDADKQVEQATTQLTKISAAIAEKKSLIASIERRIRSKELEAERLESLSRHWKTEENNTHGKGRGAARSRAVKISDQANQVRLGISKAKQTILDLRHDIGQLLKAD